MADDHNTPSPSFRDRRIRRKITSLNISCFRCHRHSDSHLHSPTPSPPIKKSPSTFIRSSKLKINDLTTLLDHGGNHRRHHTNGGTAVRRQRQHSSTEFTYDPISYSLNFEEEGVHAQSFMSRLPVSPPATNKLEESNT